MRVNELKPGDRVSLIDQSATLIIVHSPHPLYPHLWMVIWRMEDGKVMFDALLPNQELPIVWLDNSPDNIRKALGITK